MFGVPRLPVRPCDERPPAMYGHFCLVQRVSVHDRYYCTRGKAGGKTTGYLKSQVVLLQTAHSWANAGVLLGARMHRERGSFRNS